MRCRRVLLLLVPAACLCTAGCQAGPGAEPRVTRATAVRELVHPGTDSAGAPPAADAAARQVAHDEALDTPAASRVVAAVAGPTGPDRSDRAGKAARVNVILHRPETSGRKAAGEAPEVVAPGRAAEPHRDSAAFEQNTYPIDLANALALAGANNLQIRLARERVLEAQANLDQARLIWIPSLRAGIGYNKHDGRLQATEGEVIEAGRNSLFVGGGAGLGGHPLTGGTSGPARLQIDLSLADAAFEPLVARQLVRAQSAARATSINDTLLAVALGYFDLVEAHGLSASAEAGVAAARQMADVTGAFAREGMGARSEVDRANAELAFWRQQAAESRRLVQARSAELVRLLRLEPGLVLVPVEDRPAPVELVDEQAAIEVLVAQGLASRPELAQQRALVRASLDRLDQERWRPWLPNLAVGASAGSFGGGPSSQFENQGSRSDFDALAAWELRNLGFGNGALRRERGSQMRQARLETGLVRDRVAAEIVTAASDVASYRRQFEIALDNIAAASEALRLSLERISQGEGLPIELQQAIRARTEATNAYARAVADYNRAQARLLRAIGEPPAAADAAAR